MLKNTTIKLILKNEGISSSRIKKAAQFCGLNFKKALMVFGLNKKAIFIKLLKRIKI